MKTSWRHVLKTSWRYILKTSSRRLQRNNFLSSKTSSRRLQNVFARRLQDVFKSSWKTKYCYAENILKTSSRPANVCWEVPNYCLCSGFFFHLNTNRTRSNSEKNVYLINTKAIKKKVWFSFDSLITLINKIPLYC